MRERKRGIRTTVLFEPRLLGIAIACANKYKKVDKEGNFAFPEFLHRGVYEMEDELIELRKENKALRAEKEVLNEILKTHTGTDQKIRCGYLSPSIMVDVSEEFCIACQLKSENIFCPKIKTKPKVPVGFRNYRDETVGARGY